MSRELFKKLKEWIITECSCDRNDVNELEQIEKDLEILEILKPRVRLKDSTLKNAHFTIDENGLPVCENDFKEADVAFIETSGFVFKNSNEYKLLTEWLENERK